MALTPFQRRVCRLLAQRRIDGGERYVAGAVALNEQIGAPRISQDVGLFHDTDAALQASWSADRGLLEGSGLTVAVLRERATFERAIQRLASEEGEDDVSPEQLSLPELVVSLVSLLQPSLLDVVSEPVPDVSLLQLSPLDDVVSEAVSVVSPLQSSLVVVSDVVSVVSPLQLSLLVSA